MTYRQLIQFDPIDEAVRIGDADRRERGARLVSSYAISGRMADRLTGTIFPNLQFARPGDNKALMVVGGHGTGKSHLMAFVSSLAEHADLAELVTNPKLLAKAQDADGREVRALAAVAGSFKVVRAAVAPGKASLREMLLGRIEGFLASQGVVYSFPTAPGTDGGAPQFEGMMAAFHQKFPEQGLLLVVDDLFDLLLTRRSSRLILDLNFLNSLCEACRDSRFRLIAGLRESIFDNHRFAPAAETLGLLQPRCETVALNASDVSFVVSERLTKKTPDQTQAVREYLAPFAGYFGDMHARLEEFAASFPLHPDYSGIFEKNDFADQRGVLHILSDAVARRLEQPLPGDRPGVIAYDSYWEDLCRNPACRSMPETAEVIDFTRRLETRIERAVTRPEYRELALRIVHALSLHRLSMGDIYSGHGASPAELRDTLCLFQPGLEELAEKPADSLLAHVTAVLGEIRKCGNENFITLGSENGQYYLHFKKFKRFITPELVLHWVNALPFLVLMLTGGIMLASRFFQLERQLFAWTVIVHKVCAITWLCALPLTVLMRARQHWAHIRIMLSWGAEDAVWMIQSLRTLYDKKAEVPAADRFNTGQKINACLVIMYYFGFASTGLAMLWMGTILFPWYIHVALFFSAMGSVGGHLFLAMINPSTRIAFAGIFHGWAPMKYVEHHHPLSLPKTHHKHRAPVKLKTVIGQILVSKVDLIILTVAACMAVAGVFIFSMGRTAEVKRQFAKSFADLIQPSALSTKHRIGETSEKCTKCHLFTGALPNSKCEYCHPDIKERRDKPIGYHGTLKGECRYCHREHQTRSRSIVPLDREKFDHNLADFRLEGRHARLACDDCHKKLRAPDSRSIYYIGLKHGACTDCHRDPHAGQFKFACDKCHTPKGWKGADLKFAHGADSGFALQGKHAELACAKCHTPGTPKGALASATFKGLPTDCPGCHTDPHRKQFESACTVCHSAAGWRGKDLVFDHNKASKFPLTAKHAETACAKCHAPLAPGDQLALARFRGLNTGCADCHKDPHRGQLGAVCTKCHATPTSWTLKNLQFTHARDSVFALAGKHATVECIKCHQPQPAGGTLASGKFKGLGTGCDACHNVKHPESYGKDCTACHTPDAWPRKQPPFDHKNDSRFTLVGKHLSLSCSACHTSSRMSALARPPALDYACVTCHKRNDPHNGTLGDVCSKCHTAAGWKGKDLLFNHDIIAKFPLKLYHKKVACEKCHVSGKWKPVSTSCDSCHPEGGKKP